MFIYLMGIMWNIWALWTDRWTGEECTYFKSNCLTSDDKLNVSKDFLSGHLTEEEQGWCGWTSY